MSLTLSQLAQKTFSLCLILNLSLPCSQSFAAEVIQTSSQGFESILLANQTDIDLGRSSQTEGVQKFADQLIESNVSVKDIDLYVQSKLTPSEFQAYQTQARVMMRGIDPARITPGEFSQVVSHALEVTQPRALTWSSCSTATVGILVAVAAVVVGIIAIAKRKIDHITEDGLYNSWQKNISNINSRYSDTSSKLNDPQGYFNKKISDAQDSISSKKSENSNKQTGIENDRAEVRRLENSYDSADTDEERDHYRSAINHYESEINDYQKAISDNQSSITSLQEDITSYQSQKVRYLDPQVVINERAQLEAWLPAALLDAKQEYTVNLTTMPADNLRIDAENVNIARTKRTLGIIAGAGGAASLGLILSSVGSCNF